MKKIVGLMLVVMIIVIGGACNATNNEVNDIDENNNGNIEENTSTENGSTNNDTSNEAISIAETFIDLYASGQYEEAATYFDETMTSEFPLEMMEAVWEQVTDEIGNLIDYEYDQTISEDSHDIVLFNGLFEGGEVVFVVSVTEEDEIAGFYVQ